MNSRTWISHLLMIAFNIGCGGLNVFIQEDVNSNQVQFFCWWRLVRLDFSLSKKDESRNATQTPGHRRTMSVVSYLDV